jgi:dCTP deaminase
MTSLVGEDLKKLIGPFEYEYIKIPSPSFAPSPSSETWEDASLGLAPSDRGIKRLIDNGQIMMEPQPEEDQIQPGSLELRVGSKVYVTDRTFSSLDAETLKRHAMEEKELNSNDQMILYPGLTYIIESHEAIRLPENIEGETDTKSTVGRLGASCLAAGEKFSHISSGSNYSLPQKILMVVEPYAFPIIIHSGKTRLFQIRFRYRGTDYATADEIKKLYGREIILSRDREGKEEIPISDALDESGLRLTLNTKKAFAQRTDSAEPLEPLDLTKKDYYDPGKFWEVIRPNEHGEIVMEKDRLYLFGSRETANFKNTCGRLRREDPYVGVGFILHFAGFFDPGFCGETTLEFWSARKRVLKEGQHTGRLLIEDLTTPAMRHYGNVELGSSYAGQSAPRLAKIFRHSSEFE